jgi:V8-like Glu-specific endopeptidase
VIVGRSAQQFQGYPNVGELFEDNNGTLNTHCTASTISPPSGTANPQNLQLLILTAAHCVDSIHDGVIEAATNLAFAPQYDSNGQDNMPYGLWTVRSAVVNSAWTTCSIGCPPYDYAVLVLEPLNGAQLGSIVGANAWSISEPRTIPAAQLVGYTDADTQPLLTTTKVIVVKEDGHTYRKAESTPGFGIGTSGSPFFASYNTTTHVGTVFGDIGGFQQGGRSASPSYSSCWTSAFARLVTTAFDME